MSDPESNSQLVFPRVLMRVQDSRENKTNWFPEGPDNFKWFDIFVDLKATKEQAFNSGANQNSRLGTYKNTNLILKTAE